MITEELGVSELCDIADKDASRIRRRIYAAAGRPEAPPAETEKFSWPYIVCGRGLDLPVKSGYEAFKTAYRASEAWLLAELPKYLEQNPFSVLDLIFHYHLDSDCNCRGDTGWFQYRISLTEPEYYI